MTIFIKLNDSWSQFQIYENFPLLFIIFIYQYIPSDLLPTYLTATQHTNMVSHLQIGIKYYNPIC